MAVCETCGNEYDKSFDVLYRGVSHTFDCFECAIQGLAPLCAGCGCRIIGHPIRTTGESFCCTHCAQGFGHTARMIEDHDRVT